MGTGDSFATSYAEALAKAIAAAIGPDTSAVCLGDIKAVAVGVARAAATAISRSCVNGSGSASNFQSRFVQATSTAIARAVATATAVVCNSKLLYTHFIVPHCRFSHWDHLTVIVCVRAEPKTESKCGVDVFGSSNTSDNTVNIGGSRVPPPSGGGGSSGSSFGSSAAGQVDSCTDYNDQRCCFEASW